MMNFLQSENNLLKVRIENLEYTQSKMKDYLDYLTGELNKLHESMVEISSEEYLEFKKMKVRDKRIEKLIEDEDEEI